MIEGMIYRLEYQTKVKVWVFPEDRFIQWGPEDESYCRLAGYGREEEQLQTFIIPRAYVKNITVNGIDFVALPQYENP